MNYRRAHTLLKHVRLNHWTAVLSRDIFIKDQSLGKPARETIQDHNFQFYPTSSTEFSSTYLDGTDSKRNSDLREHFDRNPQLKKLLESRAHLVQRFLGNSFKLPFDDLLPIICGLANMKIEHRSSPTGSAFEKGFVHQSVLREVGKRLFECSLNSATIFTGLSYLSMSQSELEHNLAYFKDYDRLIIEFMRRQLLYDCSIPYRGIQDYGLLLTTDAELLRVKIKDKTAIGSFFSLLGVLVLRFGTTRVNTEFIHDKVLSGSNGIYSIASSKRNE